VSYTKIRGFMGGDSSRNVLMPGPVAPPSYREQNTADHVPSALEASSQPSAWRRPTGTGAVCVSKYHDDRVLYVRRRANEPVYRGEGVCVWGGGVVVVSYQSLTRRFIL
jgi:hypothetical protein